MNPLFNGLAAVVGFVLSVLQILVIASVVASWIGDRNNQIVQMIFSVTEPMFKPIRKITDNIPGPFDWAPMAFLVIIIFLQQSLVTWLQQMARGG
jgi:YggT family protein